MTIMRRAHWPWSIRRVARTAVGALWLAGLSTAALSHGAPTSQHLLTDAFAATLIWFVLRFPRLVLGVLLVSLLSVAVFARPRRRC